MAKLYKQKEQSFIARVNNGQLELPQTVGARLFAEFHRKTQNERGLGWEARTESTENIMAEIKSLQNA